MYRHRFHKVPIGSHSTKHTFRDTCNRVLSWNCSFTIIFFIYFFLYKEQMWTIAQQTFTSQWTEWYRVKLKNAEYSQIMCTVWKYRFQPPQMYKLLNNRTIIYGVIDLLIQLSLCENARNGLFCSQLSLRENGKEACATTDLHVHVHVHVYTVNTCSSQLALCENGKMPHAWVLPSQRVYKTMRNYRHVVNQCEAGT